MEGCSLIIMAIRKIVSNRIKVVIGTSYPSCFSDLVKRVIYVPKIDCNCHTYYWLKHEYYHFTVLPINAKRSSELLVKLLDRIDSRYYFLAKPSLDLAIDVVVDRYGVYYDEHKGCYYKGWMVEMNEVRQYLPEVAELLKKYVIHGYSDVLEVAYAIYNTLVKFLKSQQKGQS